MVQENHWPREGSQIAVCMSGGVDSSISAYILHKKGYKVIGLTGWLIKGTNRCCDSGMIDATKVCEQIGIKHVSKDLRMLFKQEIVDPFINSYQAGSTPIPCITCNTTIKWGSLMHYAFSELSCTHIATGHYAKLISKNDVYKIIRPKDLKKDQTFMLWGLTQEMLSKTVFPLADITKAEVRAVGACCSKLLHVADKEESQDICFVSKKESTQKFLEKFLQPKEGFIIENKTGKILGTHQGTHNYTIGQRKGMGIAHSEPLYVVDLDIENNIVFAGTKDELEKQELIARDVNWILPVETRLIASLRAKIRYNSKTSPAKVSILDNNQVKVVFNEPQSAITPGQACVFYDENDQTLLGGGWIV
ncbi:MAG: tRNA 2-thiouridine(34) synthase MnmA [Candidatus Melainabacteria bacterium]|nr:tRNA 2-thiouridine(34) synthase MnmA [Candidatus Melainabacteria bacterium]